LYGDAHRRVRLNGGGSDIHLADFAILGRLDYRSDTELNDGITGFFGLNSTLSRLWVEHTKTGIWVDNSSNLVVDGCRFRDTIADGVNFCVGMRNSTIRNCTARGTGDDGFAIWPATHAPQAFRPGGNVISHCTAQFPFLANGAAIYGGEGNRIEACRFVDVAAGCGVLISTAFPTSDPAKQIDNNFSGTTVVCDCDLVRCGGYDPFWRWRGALQLCLDRHGISGLDLRDLNIQDSLADGLSIVASDSARGRERLTGTRLRRVAIAGAGTGVAGHHGLSVASDVSGSLGIADSQIAGEENSSSLFTIERD
jgi:parallel beta-helix repeat protein